MNTRIKGGRTSTALQADSSDANGIVKVVPDDITINQNLSIAERLISAAAGGALLYSVLARPSRLLGLGAAAYLFYRAATGNCVLYNFMGGHVITYPRNVNVRTSVMVDRPRSEVYHYWRRLSNLPSFMKHITRVEELDNKHSEWSASIPGLPMNIRWKATIVLDKEDEAIGWESSEGSPLHNAGKVEFVDIGEGRTRVNVTITYRAPAGLAGEKLAQALNPAFERMVLADLQGFKSAVDIPFGQPAGI
ncbi:SRPBCC family protein [Chryseolinea sp. T2]|uniref:SRPBCC family protein n=1 Tax=Chryseolinea sp. T2 TaxID=3129255 RepID=UPI00307860C3